MDFTQLKYFLRVAELKSFSKAADALHIAQPAITRQIRLLEEELGVQLLHRHSRGSEPTPAGLVLKSGAEAILRLTLQVRGEVISQALVPTGAVRIGFPPSVGNLLIGSTVSHYREMYPNVLVTLIEGYNQILEEWLLSDRIDIAVMTQFEGHPHLSSRLFYDESLWILGPREQTGKSQKSYAFKELSTFPLIQTSNENSLRKLLERTSEAHGFTLNIVIQAEALTVIRDLVRRGVGYHIAPYSAMVGAADHTDFSCFPIHDLSISRYLVNRKDRPVTRAVAEMLHTISEELMKASVIAKNHIVVAPILN